MHMRLKRVKISGFKTFADRTEFELDGALTSVVGPNGCGKSNLVDAILWGLGEGNARHLRAQSGVDVIFSGSSRRKPVGLAEVSLHFDNEDGSLPVPTSEVVISRRLNRAGESEYSINRMTCRLRDVLELLADSGLGRAGYSIVSQKEIDSALAASADERRAWVDEAAGVQRYRTKKVESQRRLASAREHLIRVADILRELEVQRQPLEQEAQVAAKYKAATAALKEIESGILIQELAKAHNDIVTLEERRRTAKELIEKEARETARMESELAAIGESISALESDMDSLRASVQGAITLEERVEADLRVGEQKLIAFDSLQSSLFEEQEGAKARIAEIEHEIVLLTAEAEAESKCFGALATSLSGAKEEALELKRRLDELEDMVAAARRAESERMRREEEVKVSRGRAKEIQEELKGIEAALPELEEGFAQAQISLETAQLELKELSESIAACIASREEIEVQAASIEDTKRKLASERAFLDGRRRGIEATLEAHEGLAHGSRAVLEATERGKLEGSFVPVAEAITVEGPLVRAVETALGSAANDLIVESNTQALAAIDYLKGRSLGVATFHPRNILKGTKSTGQEKVNAPNGAIGFASRLITCADENRAVIEGLLGRVLLCENIEKALTIANDGRWDRIITLDGEVVFSSGAISGGRSNSAKNGLLHRRSELADVISQIEGLDNELAELETKTETLMQYRALHSEELAELKQRQHAAGKDVEEAAKWASAIKEELAAAQRSGARLRSELQSLSAIEFTASNLPEQSIEELERLRTEAVRAFAMKSADAEQGAARITEAETRAKVAAERLAGAQRRLEVAHAADQNRLTKLTSIDPERKRVRKEIERAEEELKAARDKRAQLDSALGKVSAQRSELLEASHRMSEDLRSLRLSAGDAAEAAHQAELAWARAEARRANAAERLLDEYGITTEQALDSAGGIELPPDAASLGARLRREIKAMGEVNVGAIEAFERVSARIVELFEQKTDIESGIEEIEQSIAELDKLTRSRFETTFEAVQTAFREIFERLFPGGRGDLILTNPNSTLESGIEVDVQLPGKKKQRLELLSGGERALCATAFLFSLLRVKPSPLVVLDEVDAPLDGRNVEKFIELLKDFASDIQFIVITHNRTTIGECPVWLGITMNEPGVSTLVPVKVRPQGGAAMLA